MKRLGLNPVKEIDRKIYAFGTDKGKGMRLKEYEIVIKPMNKSSSIYINALAIPVICAPICRKYLNVKLAKEQNEFLQALKLADNGDNKSGNVDMLIGADVYWDIITGNIKRNPNTGLVAISSAFGWLMNGPVTNRSDKSEEKLNVAVNTVKNCVTFLCCTDMFF